MAQFDALKAQVQQLQSTLAVVQADQAAIQGDVDANTQAIADLQARKSPASDLYLTIAAPNLTPAVHRINARVHAGRIGVPAATTVANPCSDLGTFAGSPTESDSRVSGKLSGTTCTGYAYVITASRTGEESVIQGPAHDVFFTAADCTGTGYIAASVTTLTSGAVFTYRNNVDHSVLQYAYVPAGSTTVAGSTLLGTIASVISLSNGGNCINAPNFTQVSEDFAQIAVNDPSVSGLDSATVPGPVQKGQPGGQ